MKDWELLKHIPKDKEEKRKFEEVLAGGWDKNWWGRFKGNRWIKAARRTAKNSPNCPSVTWTRRSSSIKDREAFIENSILLRAAGENRMDIVAEILHRNEMALKDPKNLLHEIMDANLSVQNSARGVIYILLTNFPDLCETILPKSKSWRGRGKSLSLLEEVIESDDFQIIDLITKNCSPDLLNKIDGDGDKLLTNLIKREKYKAAKLLIENKKEFIFQKNTYENTTFCYALYKFIASPDSSEICEIVQMLIDESGEIKLCQKNKISFLNIVTINCLQKLLVPKIPPDQLQNFIDLSLSKIILSLAYSPNNFGLPGIFILPKMILEFLSSAKILPEVIQALQAITDKKLELENSNLAIFLINFPDHIGYFVIECDKQNNPKEISYCDGNIPFGDDDLYNAAFVTFKIDTEKLQKLKISNLSELELFIERETPPYNKKNIEFFLQKFVVCDERKISIFDDENPVLTIPQKRGNCAFKSLNIAIRCLMAKMGMEFSDDDTIDGDGFDAYKNYRNSLIDVALDHLTNLAKGENESLREEAREFLREVVLPKADEKIVSKIKKEEDANLERHQNIKKEIENVLFRMETLDDAVKDPIAAKLSHHEECEDIEV